MGKQHILRGESTILLMVVGERVGRRRGGWKICGAGRRWGLRQEGSAGGALPRLSGDQARQAAGSEPERRPARRSVAKRELLGWVRLAF
jgi:hypothetical protein